MSFEDENPFDNNNDFQGNNDEFTINIKNVNGDSSTFTVNKGMNIKELVDKYKTENNIKGNAKVILTYQGKILSEGKKISEYDIESDETLHALVRLQGGF